jgi:hypothetical protein
MKKILMILALIVTIVATAFASEEKVNPEALQAFKAKFAEAKEVTWTVHEAYYKATFTFNGTWLNAYYSRDGKLTNVIRNISSDKLPLYLINSYRTKYPGFWITELFEISNENGFGYYLTMENVSKKIVLKSIYNSDWQLFQTIKKEEN